MRPPHRRFRNGRTALPNAPAAIIDSRKLRDYLLSTSHPIGRYKAAFFASLGFTAARWHELGRALRDHHLPLPADVHPPSPRGTKYVIRGEVRGPNGRMAVVVSVRIIRANEDRPRFVTAYPG